MIIRPILSAFCVKADHTSTTPKPERQPFPGTHSALPIRF